MRNFIEYIPLDLEKRNTDGKRLIWLSFAEEQILKCIFMFSIIMEYLRKSWVSILSIIASFYY